ncbi:MAG: oligosaccharide flippase family protein [Solirubrobacterales bacterium]
MSSSELEPPLEPGSEPGELASTVVRGAGLASAGFVMTQLLALGFFVVLARLATPADFGDLAAGTLLVNIGLMFTESGMLAALIHRKDRLEEAASTATVATALGGLGMALGALAVSPLIGALFQSSRVGDIAAASAGLLLLRSLVIVPEALLQRRFSFLRRVVIEPFGVLVFGISAVVLTANGLGVWGLLLAYYISNFADVLLSWSLLRWRPRLRRASMAMWRELVRYGRWGVASSALQAAEQQVPVVLLGRVAGAAPLGQFRYAVRMEATAGAIVVQSAAYVLFPALARITTDRDRFQDACLRSLRLMAMIGFPLALILVPLGVPAATIAFGEVWKDAGYAAMVLAGMTAVGTLISFASEVLKADGRPDILTRIRTVTLIAASLFMVLLLPFDLIGICAGLTLGAAVGATYAMVAVGRQLEIRALSLARAALPAGFAALTMVATLTPLEFLVIDASAHETAIGVVLLISETLLGATIYLFTLRLVSPENADELVLLVKQLLTRRDSSHADQPPDGEPESPPETEALSG